MNPLLLARVLARRRTLRRHEQWSHEELAAHRDALVARLRAYAVRHSPFYARLHRGLESAPLSALPVVTKADLMGHFDEVVTDRRITRAGVQAALATLGVADLYLGRYQVVQTAGSTGTRGLFLSNPSEWAWILASYSRPYGWAGVRVDLVHRTSMAVVSSRTSWHQSARVAASVDSPLIRSLRLDAADRIEDTVRALNEFRPRSLVAYASMLGILAEEKAAGRLAIEPHAIVSASEVLTPAIRRAVHAAFGVEPCNVYAATEPAGIAAECTEHSGLHLFEDLVLTEIVDEQYRPVPAGTAGARVLVTVFFSRTQPLIRYEMSDRLVGASASCRCGRPFALIRDVEGRAEDILILDGVRVHPVVFDSVLSAAAPRGWQVQQTSTGVTVRVVKGGEMGVAELRDQVRAALSKSGVTGAQVQVQLVDQLTRTGAGKLKLIVRS